MIIKETIKNLDTGAREIIITLTEPEVDYLKECILLVLDRKLGDSNDPERLQIMDGLAAGFHQAFRLLNPS